MATIKEIAALAGVSRGTVDRVLNDRGAVNPETAEKIRKIAKELDYNCLLYTSPSPRDTR